MFTMYSSLCILILIVSQREFLTCSRLSEYDYRDSSDNRYDEEENGLEPRIWNGTVISRTRHPFFVLIEVRRLEFPLGGRISTFWKFCSGTLLNSVFAITAANCFFREVLDRTEVIVWYEVSSAEHRENGTRIRVRNIYLDPAWKGYQEGPNADYALLHLVSEDFRRWQPKFFPRLPRYRQDEEYIDTGRFTTLLGIGRPDYVLKEIQVQLRNRSCRHSWMDKYNVCYFVTDAQICIGDSGGPIFTDTDQGLLLVALHMTKFGCGSVIRPAEDFGLRISTVVLSILNTILLYPPENRHGELVHWREDLQLWAELNRIEGLKKSG